MFLKKIILLSSVLITSQAHAIFGAGDIVSDLQAYTYSVTQIEEAQKAYKQATTQLEQIQKTKDMTFGIKNSLTDSYKRALTSLKRLESMKERIMTIQDPSLFFDKNLTRDELNSIKDFKKFKKNVSENIDDVFDPDFKNTKNNKISDWFSQGVKQQQLKQVAYKQALITSEMARAEISTQIEDVEALAKASNSTKGLKDSSDVGNAILLKMLENQQKTIELLASINSVLAMNQYKGIKKHDIAKRPIRTNTISTGKDQKGRSPSDPFYDSISLLNF